LFYNGSEEEGRENFKAFFDLSKLTDKCPRCVSLIRAEPVFDATREMPFEALNTISVRRLSVFVTCLDTSGVERNFCAWGRLLPEECPVLQTSDRSHERAF
jgi:hypothetical protein